MSACCALCVSLDVLCVSVVWCPCSLFVYVVLSVGCVLCIYVFFVCVCCYLYCCVLSPCAEYLLLSVLCVCVSLSCVMLVCSFSVCCVSLVRVGCMHTVVWMYCVSGCLCFLCVHAHNMVTFKETTHLLPEDGIFFWGGGGCPSGDSTPQHPQLLALVSRAWLGSAVSR